MKSIEIKSAFASKHVLVIGDIMLDKYIVGSVSRISPEAPVPIVNFKNEYSRLGGAANVALNLVALGAKTSVCSVIGTDAAGEELIQLFEENFIDTESIVKSTSRITTVKTRVLGNNQQLLRIDSEQNTEISSDEAAKIIFFVQQKLETGIDAIIFEDYNKGVLTPTVIQSIISLAKSKGIKTCVDPKKDNFFAYVGVDLFKPNFKELKEGVNLDFEVTDKKAFENAVELLQEKLQNKITFITLSEHGVFIQEKNNKHYIPAHIRNIADVSGAGDTVISVATLCLCAGFDLKYVAAFANLAGGLVCEKNGVVHINLDELLSEIEQVIQA